MADRFFMYAALAAGAYVLLGRGTASAAAGGGGGSYSDYFMRHPSNGQLTTPFPELAPIEPTDSGSYVAPDVIPETGGVMCCQAMTPECMECAARNWSGVTRGAIGGIIPRPEQPNGAAYSYPDYFMRHPTYTTQPVPY